MSNYYKVIAIEKAEDPKNIISHLNPNLIKTIGIFQMFKINFRNSVKAFNDSKRPKNFLLNFPCLLLIKFAEIVLKEKRVPVYCSLNKAKQSGLIGQL
jgi:hypothetical protein